MRLLATRLTAIASAVKRLFSPASLFRNSEQGVWYDPSDFSTLFQNSAGTTPVTAVEQPVGLVLDKSKGLVLGAELVTNGGFDSDASWTSLTSTVISGGVAAITALAAGGSALRQSVAMTAGKTYACSYTVSAYTSGDGVSIWLGGTSGVVKAATGTVTEIIVCGATNTEVRFVARGGTALTCSIDNISVRELPGNHATQATAASRPVLSARVNQLLNSVWTGGTSGAWGSGAVAPTGWSSLVGTGSIEYSGVTARFVAAAQRPAIAYTVTVPVGANSVSATISALWSASTVEANITISAITATFSAAVTYQKNGITVSGTTSVSAGDVIGCTAIITVSGTVTARFGLGSSGAVTGDVTLTSPQLETGSTATRYQSITTATSYDTVGFPYYLKFDGVDDSLSTASIDFTSTDKMTVVAGVRKLSDAAAGVVLETSTNSAGNDGSIGVFAPNAALSQKFSVRSRGNVTSDLTSVGSQPSPYTAVITTQSDISTDALNLCINSGQNASSTADQGTGNYGNYPLYIGRRSGTSLPFNGHLYSLIVRGAQSTDSQIASAESYVNSKTGAY